MTSPSIDDHMGSGLILNGRDYFTRDGWNEGFASMFIAHKYKGYGVVMMTNTNKPYFNNAVLESITGNYSWEGD